MKIKTAGPTAYLCLVIYFPSYDLCTHANISCPGPIATHMPAWNKMTRYVLSEISRFFQGMKMISESEQNKTFFLFVWPVGHLFLNQPGTESKFPAQKLRILTTGPLRIPARDFLNHIPASLSRCSPNLQIMKNKIILELEQ